MKKFFRNIYYLRSKLVWSQWCYTSSYKNSTISIHHNLLHQIQLYANAPIHNEQTHSSMHFNQHTHTKNSPHPRVKVKGLARTFRLVAKFSPYIFHFPAAEALKFSPARSCWYLKSKTSATQNALMKRRPFALSDIIGPPFL